MCQELGLDYLVRIRPDVPVSSPRYRGTRRKYPVHQGIAHVLRDVDDRKDRRVKHHIVIRGRPDLPKKRDEPWFLRTNLEGRAQPLCQLYGRRMSVEERFRDTKSRRNGWAVRNTKIQHADRFDRFLLILALASILLAGMGLQAMRDYEPSWWCTNRRPRECSVFTIGRAMLEKVNYLPDQLLQMVPYATIQVAME